MADVCSYAPSIFPCPPSPWDCKWDSIEKLWLFARTEFDIILGSPPTVREAQFGWEAISGIVNPSKTCISTMVRSWGSISDRRTKRSSMSARSAAPKVLRSIPDALAAFSILIFSSLLRRIHPSCASSIRAEAIDLSDDRRWSFACKWLEHQLALSRSNNRNRLKRSETPSLGQEVFIRGVN